MSKHLNRYLPMIAAALLTLAAPPPARADDTELFVGDAVAGPVRSPNILFVLDTSGSMSSLVKTQVPYNAADTYSGDCRSDDIYWSANDKPPVCDGTKDNNGDGYKDDEDQYIKRASFRCNAALANLDSAGIAPVARAARWRNSSGSKNDYWAELSASDQSSYVECQEDLGIHGPDAASPNKWPGNQSNGPWTSNSAKAISWSGTGGAYTFYTGNYLNWRKSPYIEQTRLEIMQNVATTVLKGLSDDLNVGLMRYSNDGGWSSDTAAQGGMVIHAIEPLVDGRAAMISAINSWDAEGWTPLSETLYEAAQYLRGDSVYFGGGADAAAFPSAFSRSDVSTSNPNGDTPSVAKSRRTDDKSRYDSPLDLDCQRTYIVYLTDGLPTQDNEANGEIEDLPDFQKITGAAQCDIEPGLQYSNSGRCTDNLARWLRQYDLRPDVIGKQTVTSYWIGFGSDVATGTDFLKHVAAEGGGKYYSAVDTAELLEAFTDIIVQILAQSTTFTAPAVAVNAFNRTQNLNYLYMSVFKPAASYRWLGNIKKYRITPDGEILDVGGDPAIDAQTGFFSDSSQSYWSDAIDGNEATAGGAAGEIKETAPDKRTIFSNLTDDSGPLAEELADLKDAANLDLANQLLLGTDTPAADRPSVASLVDWAYGVDVLDANGDGDATDPRLDMGDALHSRPATVVYGGTADNPDVTLFGTSNDGALHAIDAEDGTEYWAFMPRELLPRIESLYNNEDVAQREYGLDSSVRVLRIDRNNNGIIEQAKGDRVYLFFGMRRGGSSYYGLDVTDRGAPELMWIIGPSELPGVGQSWSAPTVARVNVDRNWTDSNPDKTVLVFGGGYDTVQDNVGYAEDSVGNRVFMVDAITGARIWFAGPASSGANLTLTKMNNAIAADVRVIDLTGDGYADRMYAADLGGRVWRFDIWNGKTPASLVTGGVLASLGHGDLAGDQPEDSRRFFYAPDVSLIKAGSTTWINVAIGSGHREKPITDMTAVNRFYSLRDYLVFGKLKTDQYQDTCDPDSTEPCHQIITDDDDRLVDVTDKLMANVPPGGVGWKMDLVNDGEKVLAESRTFQNRIYFTSYSPTEQSYDPAICVSSVGLNRLYVVDAATAKPVVNFDQSTPGVTTVSDKFKELAQGSIAPEATFIFPTPDDPNSPAVPPICLVGLESCGTALTNPPVRTFWQQRGVN